jgi:hypothetical protein
MNNMPNEFDTMEMQQINMDGSLPSTWASLRPDDVVEEDMQRRLSMDGVDRRPALPSTGEPRTGVATGELRSSNLGPSRLWERMISGYQRVLYLNMIAGPWAGSSAPASAFQEKVAAPSRDALTRSPAVTEAELDALTSAEADLRRALAAEAEALLGYAPLARDVRAPGRLCRALAALDISVLDQAAVDAYKRQMVEHYATYGKMAAPTWRLKPLRGYAQPVPEHVLAKAVAIKKELPEAEFYVDQLAVDPFLVVTVAPLPDPAVNRPTRALDPETAAYVEVWDEPKFEGR